MIPSRRVFEDHAGDYDRWFDEHGVVYQAQLRMLRGAIPDHGRGLEVGPGRPFPMGSGRTTGHPNGYRSLSRLFNSGSKLFHGCCICTAVNITFDRCCRRAKAHPFLF